MGNILAAYYAKKMGIPIGKLICASNQNNVLTDFFNTGTYDMNRPFYTTISPSMDILESSNFERFLYYISGEDSERTAQWMKDLKSTGKLSVNEEEFKRIQANFSGAYVNDEETKAIIEQVYNSYGYLMDPHTAVAMGAYMKELEAHPEMVLVIRSSHLLHIHLNSQHLFVRLLILRLVLPLMKA